MRQNVLPSLDQTDLKLIALMTDNARTSLADLGRAVGMSSPSVSERIKRMEDAGVITGYRVEVDPVAVGYALMALVRIRPLPGQLKRVAEIISEIPEFTECDKVTGDDCYIARLQLRRITDLDPILERVTERAETNTSIVKTTLIPRRLPPIRSDSR